MPDGGELIPPKRVGCGEAKIIEEKVHEVGQYTCYRRCTVFKVDIRLCFRLVVLTVLVYTVY
jgi:hypothetical protein